MPTTREGLEGLGPVLPDGSHTFGSQTHPADGNCALIVTTKEKAGEFGEQMFNRQTAPYAVVAK